MGLFSKKKKDEYLAYAEKYSEEYELSAEGILQIGKGNNSNASPYALTPDEIKGDSDEANSEAETVIPMESASETLYKRMMDTRKAKTYDNPEDMPPMAAPTETLLSKCSAFVNEEGKAPAILNQPAYRLDSIDDIIADAEKRAQERVKHLYSKPVKTTDVETEKSKPEIKDSMEVTPVTVTPPAPKAPVSQISDTAAKAIITPPPAKPTENMIKPPVASYVKPDANTSSDAASKINIEDTINIAAIKREEPIKNYQYRFADDNSESTPQQDATEKTVTFDAVKSEGDVSNTDGGSTVTFNAVKEETFTAGLQPDAFNAVPDDNIQEETDEKLFGDYLTVKDAPEIRKALKDRKRRLSLRFMFTLIAAVIMLLPAIPVPNLLPESVGNPALIIQTALIGLVTLVNFRMFSSIINIIKSDGSRWLAACVTSVIALIFGIYSVINNIESAKQFGFIPAFCILFLLAGEIKEINRIISGLNIIADSNDKNAIALIGEKDGSEILAQNAVDGSALIAVPKRTTNINDFLKNSYSASPLSHAGSIITILGFIASLGMFAYGYITNGMSGGLYFFTLFTCIISSFGADIFELYPIRLASKRLAEYNAVFAGHSSVEKLEPTNAIVLNTSDIFPKRTVKLYNMRILSPNSIDSTILDAAAVATEANSPLGHVFRRIAKTSKEYALPKADSVKYENRLGISGWVDDHSILIGNRSLMEAHGVAVPPLEVDRKILRNGYFPIYVASDCKPCALLIVGYEVDPDINYELHRLCAEGVTVLINNCDPNVSEEMLSNYFSIPEDYLFILNSAGSKHYEDFTAYKESVSACAAYKDGACGIASIITAAVKVKRLSVIMYILGVILTVIGLAGAITLSVMNLPEFLMPVYVFAFMLVSRLIVSLPAFLSRP